MPTLPRPDGDAALRYLRTPEAHARHAGAVGQVETIESHMSWVFLAGEHALKLKKPVRYPFLDFSTPAAREAACREEVRLNARLAAGVYRGLMVLQWRAGALSLVPEAQADANAATLDWLVWMRRLPAARMLDRAIATGSLEPAAIDALADTLAEFYRGATAVAIDPAEYVARFQREQAVSREVLLRPQFQLDGAAAAHDSLDDALQAQRDAQAQRAAQRRIVDGHGDLRPEHVCLLQPPVVVDCLEFNARLRQVDPLDELAFFALECELAGASWIGPRLLGRYGALLDDPAPAGLLDLYTAYRALLRARLAIAHLLDPQPRTPQRWAPLAQRYVARALQALRAVECAANPATSRGTR
ncbi:MAG TPA: hypothetical protein VFK10_02655 [Burkholderiaceae bacterium]|nr:hypothetical protein [Burkholderiaceae bacterium]